LSRKKEGPSTGPGRTDCGSIQQTLGAVEVSRGDFRPVAVDEELHELRTPFIVALGLRPALCRQDRGGKGFRRQRVAATENVVRNSAAEAGLLAEVAQEDLQVSRERVSPPLAYVPSAP
jgi:hypothetical protein